MKYVFPNKEEYLTFLRQAPKEGWKKKRSLGGNKETTYIPIEVQEALVDFITDKNNSIIKQSFEIKEVSRWIDNKGDEKITPPHLLGLVTIDILPSYPGAEHKLISGSAFTPIQATGNSLEYLGPKTISAAIGNAYEAEFGNVMGKNLNRDTPDDLYLPIDAYYDENGKVIKVTKPKKNDKSTESK